MSVKRPKYLQNIDELRTSVNKQLETLGEKSVTDGECRTTLTMSALRNEARAEDSRHWSLMISLIALTIALLGLNPSHLNKFVAIMLGISMLLAVGGLILVQLRTWNKLRDDTTASIIEARRSTAP